MPAQILSSNLDSWNDALQSLCGPYKTEPARNASLFIGEVRASEKAGLTLAHMKTNADSIHRDVRPGESVDDRYCFMVSQRRGRSTIRQGGVDIRLSPGDIILMDSVAPCEIKPEGLMEHASLCLPRAEIRSIVNIGTTLFGKVSMQCASGRILHSMFDELCSDVPIGESREAEDEAIIAAYTSLLGTSLRCGDDDHEVMENLSGAGLRKFAEKLINGSLDSPSLSPGTLAEELRISVRHLYRLFEEEGESVCRYIQRARLQRSAEDLSSSRFKHETITSIAYRWGFADSAHFSRSFKKEFCCSPREYRNTALGVQ
ncbi:transcriptional regulator FeaR [Marinobacter sp. GN3S48]|uniref:transcriptional regulator FeaR n=1 Tax=Marinobacter sp. GN3S48 TaxID=3382302 RepID=UPI00387AF3F4